MSGSISQVGQASGRARLRAGGGVLSLLGILISKFPPGCVISVSEVL